jgi:hypothetical protein
MQKSLLKQARSFDGRETAPFTGLEFRSRMLRASGGVERETPLNSLTWCVWGEVRLALIHHQKVLIVKIRQQLSGIASPAFKL